MGFSNAALGLSITAAPIVLPVSRRLMMTRALSLLVLLVVLVSAARAVEPGPGEKPRREGVKTETLLFIRHAEKSPSGFGQLSCRGLNRALALPVMLAGRFKRIDAVFAPDPSRQKPDGALSYDYVRPLATVEPTAVWFGLPVHAAIGYDETDKLKQAILLPEFRDRTVLVAWEHHAMNAFVPALVGSLGGDAGRVPKWAREDFDSIWRVTIAWTDDHAEAAFAHEQQGLDGLAEACPNAAAPPRPRHEDPR